MRIPMLLIAAGLVMLVGCSGDSPAARYVTVDTLPGGIPRTITSQPIDSGRWQLVRDRDIQPPELDSAELMNPSDVALADDGSVLIVDRPTHIKVFDRAGQLLRRIGREGAGPGEFGAAFIAVRGDTLVVQDPRNARATTFNWRTGAILTERRTSCCYFSPMGVDGQGRAVVRAMARAPDSTWRNVSSFVRFPLASTEADTVFVLDRQDVDEPKSWILRSGSGSQTRMMMAMSVPLQPSTNAQVDPTGGFITGWSGAYMLRLTSDGRDTTALFGRAWTAVAVSGSEKRRIVDQRIEQMTGDGRSSWSEDALRASFDASMIPDTRPAYAGFRVDAAGRRWVQREDGDTTQVRFDLFDEQGRWLDVVAVPSSSWPRTAYAPAAWGREEMAVILEGDDGRPLIRVFRITRVED
ncbi:MAG TPA: hypothetical protein VF178_09180 [Gemmatimonadaceae bacterium]